MLIELLQVFGSALFFNGKSSSRRPEVSEEI